jgi:uncharacterized protein
MMPWFLLLGFDVPGFGEAFDQAAEDDLNEAHWSYMDVVADRLLARGPMLTSDHDGHTGSIHVLRADDHAAAESFAFNEPYYLAGMYERVEVVRFESWLDQSMWERSGDPVAAMSWLAVWRCASDASWPVSGARQPEVPEAVVCAGWMVDVDGHTLVGAAALVDASTDAVVTVVDDIAAQFPHERFESTMIPWRRGGRL